MKVTVMETLIIQGFTFAFIVCAALFFWLAMGALGWAAVNLFFKNGEIPPFRHFIRRGPLTIIEIVEGKSAFNN